MSFWDERTPPTTILPSGIAVRQTAQKDPDGPCGKAVAKEKVTHLSVPVFLEIWSAECIKARYDATKDKGARQDHQISPADGDASYGLKAISARELGRFCLGQKY